MNKPFNIELSGILLRFVIEAIDFRLKAYEKASMEASILDPNSSDTANDKEVYKVLLHEFKQLEIEQKKKLFGRKNILPTEIQAMAQVQRTWHKEAQILFCQKISFAVTICIRDIWMDETTTDKEKLEAIKHINEFQHWIINRIVRLMELPQDDGFVDFIEGCITMLKRNKITSGYIHHILVKSFEKIGEPEPYKLVTPNEYYMLNQALNEICNGPSAIPEWEFHSRVGVFRNEALEILDNIDRKWLSDKLRKNNL
jgi:hypothetical protein